jgi:carbamoylphosphate synthase small subunit
MRGIIATGRSIAAQLVEKTRQIAHMEGSDLVKDVTCKEAYDFEPSLADAVTKRATAWSRYDGRSGRSASPRTTTASS